MTADPTGGYVADVEELPGCITQAETWEEIRELVKDAMATWISAQLEDGRPVPVPEDPLNYTRLAFVFPRTRGRTWPMPTTPSRSAGIAACASYSRLIPPTPWSQPPSVGNLTLWM
ncbi:MAG: type II toxin-antitoxin system HicB family antitoxin [Dehalococcoidia bacterium]